MWFSSVGSLPRTKGVCHPQHNVFNIELFSQLFFAFISSVVTFSLFNSGGNLWCLKKLSVARDI